MQDPFTRIPRPIARALAAAIPGLGLLIGCTGTDLVGPFFVTQPVLTTPAGEAYAYDAHAAGLMLPQTWTLSTAPVGMSVDGDGVVAWTPAFADLGTHPVTLSVTDGARTVQQTWSLVVHQDLLLGVAYSPRGHTSSSSNDDVVEFLTQSDPWGRLIAFHSTWRDSVSDAGLVPEVAQFAQLAKLQYGIEPAVGLGWAAGDGTADLTSDGDAIDNSWTNQETRDEFKALVTAYAAIYRPAYLFLGNEINFWYWTDPAGWPDWLSMLGECYDAIKAVSPQTMVFTVFQLERLKGLGAGTTGWTDPPHWNLVDDVVAAGTVDALGFTSYPYFEYATPQAIPVDYYDEIAMHWSGPVIFTEIGWPGAAAAPFPGGLLDQRDFVGEFFDRIEGLDVEYASWLFLYDWDGQATLPGFMDIGFRNNDGTIERPSSSEWQDAVELRERP